MNDFTRKMINKRVITTKDVCNITGISRQAICRKVSEGKLEYIKKTKQGILFDKEVIKPNIDRIGKVINRFYNNEFDIIDLLISGYKVILSGSVCTGKTTILNMIKKQTEKIYHEFKLFDSHEIPKDFLKIQSRGSLAVVQADNENDALKYLSEYLDIDVQDIEKNIDFICTIEHNQITILKTNEA